MSTLIAGRDGDIPHLVSPRLADGRQPGSRRRPLARRRAALPAAGLERLLHAAWAGDDPAS